MAFNRRVARVPQEKDPVKRRAWDHIAHILNGLLRRRSLLRTSKGWRLALVDGDIPSTITRDTELAAAILALLEVHPTAQFDYSTTVGNVGTGEDDLYSSSLAAGRLGTNGDKLTLFYSGAWLVHATATRRIRQYFGGTAIFDTGDVTLSATAAWVLRSEIIRVSSSVVRHCTTFFSEGTTVGTRTTVGELTGLTLANAQVMKITAEVAGVGAATDDIQAHLGSIVKVPNA